jgi:hypothetical protein
MTLEELDRIDAEQGVDMPAIQVRPYRYAVPCTVAGMPCLNTVVHRRWRDDGRISVMLDTHNFDVWAPDEIVRVVPQAAPYRSAESWAKLDAEAEAFEAKRP